MDKMSYSKQTKLIVQYLRYLKDAIKHQRFTIRIIEKGKEKEVDLKNSTEFAKYLIEDIYAQGVSKESFIKTLKINKLIDA